MEESGYRVLHIAKNDIGLACALHVKRPYVTHVLIDDIVKGACTRKRER